MYYRNKHAITDHVYIYIHVVEDTEILPFTVWNTHVEQSHLISLWVAIIK